MTTRRSLSGFLDWLLGPRCPHGCGQRVFTADRPAHFSIEHCGDPL